MKVAPLASGMLFFAVSAAAAAADSNGTVSRPFCLQANAVTSTGVIDEKTILFHMRNGTVWKNTLRQNCPDLKFRRGFSEVVNSGQICANRQIIAVLGTNNPCQLGDFTLVSEAKP